MSTEPTPLVWYAAYGSNLSSDRFRTYLAGGPVPHRPVPREQAGARDATPARADRPWWLPHELFFAGSSPGWGDGSVAFLHPEPIVDLDPAAQTRAPAQAQAPAPAPAPDAGVGPEGIPPHGTLGRIWLVTAQQFEDVFRQENGLRVPGSDRPPGSGPHRSVEADPQRWDRGDEPLFDLSTVEPGGHVDAGPQWYGRVLHLGPGPDGHPVATFTGPDPDRHRPGPAHVAYARTVGLGLMETWGLSADGAATRLAACRGNRGALDADALARDLARW